jgi:hypothetical protein
VGSCRTPSGSATALSRQRSGFTSAAFARRPVRWGRVLAPSIADASIADGRDAYAELASMMGIGESAGADFVDLVAVQTSPLAA